MLIFRITEIGNRDEYRYWHKFLINKMQVRGHVVPNQYPPFKIQVRDIARGGNEMEFELHDTIDNVKKESTTSNQNLTITTNTMEEKRDWVTQINKEIRGLESLKGDLCNPRKTSVIQN